MRSIALPSTWRAGNRLSCSDVIFYVKLNRTSFPLMHMEAEYITLIP
jgi:hypothetical protein